MANEWLRLWHDMPSDPKWRTVSRLSGQPIHLVIAIYTFLLVDASRNVTRGHVTVTIEDLASAFDVTEEQISAVLSCMEGRVIEDGRLTGWDARQVKREEGVNPESGAKSAAERKREQRERQKMAQLNSVETINVTQCHEESRNVTQCHNRVDKSRQEVNQNPTKASSQSLKEGEPEQTPTTRKGRVCRLLREAGMADAAPSYLTDETWDAILSQRTDEEIIELAKAKMQSRPGQRTGLKYIAPALCEPPQSHSASPGNPRASPPMSQHERRRLGAAKAIFGDVEAKGMRNERVINAEPEPGEGQLLATPVD